MTSSVWCGVVWCGVVWCGVVWCGVVWCGVVWCGVVWCGVLLSCVALRIFVFVLRFRLRFAAFCCFDYVFLSIAMLCNVL